MVWSRPFCDGTSRARVSRRAGKEQSGKVDEASSCVERRKVVTKNEANMSTRGFRTERGHFLENDEPYGLATMVRDCALSPDLCALPFARSFSLIQKLPDVRL
jgi:hypothetical protein